MKFMRRLTNFLHQPDVRAHPFRALWRRLLWRAYHAIKRGEPLVLRNWYRGMRIALPPSGCAAQIFYRKHSNAKMVQVMEQILREGDVFIDVGAHIGEYSLIAAALVGGSGKVCAFEPQPHVAEFIAYNAELNGLSNVYVYRYAVADKEGVVSFQFSSRYGSGLIGTGSKYPGELEVPSITIDAFVSKEHIEGVRLIKVDAMGNEKAVLLGARRTMGSREPPAVLCKLLHPDVVRERFGYDVRETVALLIEGGFRIKALREIGDDVFVTPENCHGLFSPKDYGFPILAWRE